MAVETDRVQAIFLAASEIEDRAERARRLEAECAGDAALRARVEALLRALDQPDSLLDQPVVPSAEAEPTCEFAGPEFANTCTIGSESGSTPDDEIPLGFLQPGTRPGSLGRLGHYEMLEVLGRGGFGIVFRAFDDVLQRVVAVKVMAPQLAATSPARKRFVREAQSSAAVRHENVVQVYEIGEQPLPFLVMEFIPGETLQQRLDRTGPLDVREVLRIGRQLAEGLAAAHATDLIHRDIKPGNVLIESGQQRVKLTDFGLARAADDASISQSGIIAGTPMYMAPEQALGHKLDQRADLFSLGSVLYQMVSGRPPFRANGTLAVLKRVAEDTPRGIREIVPEAPQWLCDIIAKLHAKNPDQRYQTAREVADVLADCEEQLKTRSKLTDLSRIPHASPVEARSQSPSKRSPWRWALVPAALVLLAVLAMGLGPAARLFPFGKAEIEIATDSVKTPVVVRDAEGADAYEVQKGTTIQLPPGRYTLRVAPAADRVSHEWKITTHGFFTSTTVRHSTGADGWIEVTLARGERISVRAVATGKSPPAATVPPAAPPDHALDFAAASAQVTLPKLKLSTAEPMTLECFILVRDTQNSLFFNARTPDRVRITLGSNVGFWVEPSGGPAHRAMMNESLPVNKRVHLAFVYDGKNPQVYIDGVRRAVSFSLVKFPESEESEARIGSGRGRKVDSVFNGIVDEIRFSSVARYTGDFTPEPRFTPDKHTLALYHCDEGAGEVLKDSSGHERHGRIEGATWIKASATVSKNNLGMEFVRVPKGKAWLGGGKDRPGDKEVEFGNHFELGKYEVTQEEWETVMGENPSLFSRGGTYANSVRDVEDAIVKRLPVESVSWEDCLHFVKKLNEREKGSGWTYRMPTETEWEYAARGGPMADKAESAFDFHFTKPTNDIRPQQANFKHELGLNRTAKVGSFEPNRLGMHDMFGNVLEWCGNDDGAPDAASRPAARGGGWNAASWDYVAIPRSTGSTTDKHFAIGFRLARVPVVAP